MRARRQETKAMHEDKGKRGMWVVKVVKENQIKEKKKTITSIVCTEREDRAERKRTKEGEERRGVTGHT